MQGALAILRKDLQIEWRTRESVSTVFVLGVLVNWFAAGLLAFTIGFYVFIYTMWLKRSTPQNIVIGGAAGAFPPMVISMIDVGEETGQLPEMLLKVAEVFDDEVDNAVAGLTSLLEPIMIVFLAVIVGTIVIALFLPLISIITGMQNQGG